MRASTITPGTDIDIKCLPTVFKWEGGGKEVYIQGSFDGWKSKIPMVKRYEIFSRLSESIKHIISWRG